jgi:hypothetical protein
MEVAQICGHVAVWHDSEVPALLAYVRYRGQPGRHLLTVRFSQIDEASLFVAMHANDTP